MLYGMLMWNADAMDYDPSLLPRPDKLPNMKPEFFQVSHDGPVGLWTSLRRVKLITRLAVTLPSVRHFHCTWTCLETSSSGKGGESSKANTS